MSKSIATITMPRVWIERALDAMVHYGTHQEYDTPGDTPEPCGQWCDICNQHIDDDDHKLGHSITCPIEIFQLQLANS